VQGRVLLKFLIDGILFIFFAASIGYDVESRWWVIGITVWRVQVAPNQLEGSPTSQIAPN
jgi:hypothetical protein